LWIGALEPIRTFFGLLLAPKDKEIFLSLGETTVIMGAKNGT
jgi:hypothetical protein